MPCQVPGESKAAQDGDLSLSPHPAGDQPFPVDTSPHAPAEEHSRMQWSFDFQALHSKNNLL